MQRWTGSSYSRAATALCSVGTLATLDVVGIERLLALFETLTMSDETIAIQKIVFAEADRFPEQAATFYTDYPDHPSHDGAFSHRSRGTLDLDDAHKAAGMLCVMMMRHSGPP